MYMTIFVGLSNEIFGLEIIYLLISSENLLLSDVHLYSEGSAVLSSQLPRSSSHSICKFVPEDGSSSGHGILERTASSMKEDLLVNTRSEIEDMVCKYQGRPLIFQG